MHILKRLLRPLALLAHFLAVGGLYELLHVSLEMTHPFHLMDVLVPEGRELGRLDYFLVFAILVGVLVAIRTAREPVRPGDELTAGWLRKQLTQLREPRSWWREWRDGPGSPVFEGIDFDKDDLLDKCYANLGDQGIFGEHEAGQMLRSRWVWRNLRRLYADVMERPEEGLYDPSGFTHWGAMIWCASFLERPEVLRYVKRRMEYWRGKNAK